MKIREMPSKELLDKLLDYNDETGVFTWKQRDLDQFVSYHGYKVWNAQHAGKTAGSSSKTKCEKFYSTISIKKVKYYAHRIAAVMLGYNLTTSDEIDHIDGNGLNNRKSNLRVVTTRENALNKARQRNNTSGVVGVCFLNREKKWRARINKGGVEYTIGMFVDFDAAVSARKAAEAELGFHENHGGRDAESTK